jgi:hypothetical protein
MRTALRPASPVDHSVTELQKTEKAHPVESRPGADAVSRTIEGFDRFWWSLRAALSTADGVLYALCASVVMAVAVVWTAITVLTAPPLFAQCSSFGE